MVILTGPEVIEEWGTDVTYRTEHALRDTSMDRYLQGCCVLKVGINMKGAEERQAVMPPNGWDHGHIIDAWRWQYGHASHRVGTGCAPLL